MEWIKNNLAIISIYLTTIGVFHLNVYYYSLGINIISYLDLAEVIQLQFNYFALFVIIAIFSRIQTTRHFNNLLKDKNDNIYADLLKPNKLQRDKSSNNITKYHKFHTKITMVTIYLCLLGIFIYIAYTKNFISYPTIETIIIGFVIYYLIGFSDKYNSMLKRFGIDEKKKTVSSIDISFIILSFAATFIFARNDAFNLIVKRSEKEVTINYEDKSVVTNDSVVFAGKTKSYVFLYNRFTEQSESFPLSDVKSIKYRPGKSYKVIPYFYRVIKNKK